MSIKRHEVRCFTPEDYAKSEHFVRMRDGVQLRTHVYTPRWDGGPWPVLLTRTPYDIDTRGFPCATPERTGEIAEAMHALAADGYIFVLQDIRGTGGSEGRFTLTSLNPAGSTDPDESSDAYDTIEWVISSLPDQNGRVGVFGFSYGGFTTLAALVEPHPAICAASPQAAMADMFSGDDFYMNGTFQIAQALGLAVQLETGSGVRWTAEDAYDFFLASGGVDAAGEQVGAADLPTWRAVRDHPTYGPFWTAREPALRLVACDIPCLHVIGWFDVEDFAGPLSVWRAMSESYRNHPHHLVIGPWRHGAWVFRARGSAGLGPLTFGEDTTHHFQRRMEAVFFRAWLKDGHAPDLPRVSLYEIEGAGWREAQAWPIPNQRPSVLHLLADGLMSKNASPASGAQSLYSDPNRPAPYTRYPVGFYSGRAPGDADPDVKTRARALFAVEDQTFLDGRKDVLTWRSDPLTDDVLLDGAAELIVTASADIDDFDLVVHLFDERARAGQPAYQLPVSRGALRASLRYNREHPEPVPVGHAVEYRIPLQARLFRFRAGGRIGLRIMSSWFPMFAAHPQRFNGTDPYEPSDPLAGQITVLYRGATRTRLILPTAAS